MATDRLPTQPRRSAATQAVRSAPAPVPAARPATPRPAPPRKAAAWRALPWSEILGLLFFGAAIVMTLAMVSYNTGDPSWNSTGAAAARVRNWTGPFGAKLADLLYQSFGWAAWVWPFTFFMTGYWQWKDPNAEFSKRRLVGIFLMVVAFTGFLTMLGSDHPTDYRLGGFIGYWLVYGPGIGLYRFLGAAGAFVALIVLFLIGLQVASSFSLAALVMGWPQREEKEGATDTFFDSVRSWIKGEDDNRVVEVPTPITPRIRKRTGPLIAHRDEASGELKATERAGSLARRRGDGARQPIIGAEAAPLAPGDIGEVALATPPLDEEETIVAPIKNKRRNSGAAATAAAAAAPADVAEPAGGRANRRQAAKPEAVNDESPEDWATDETDAIAAAAPRSIDEMVATASVKRPEQTEETSKPRATSKLEKALKNVSRMLADYKLPMPDMLTPGAPRSELAETELFERARVLAEKCAEFNVSGQVKQISPGPVVTTFEFKPDPGVKYSRITGLVDDLCLGLRAESIRIDRIPGKSTVGIEVPNEKRETIRLREIIEWKKFRESPSKLTLALGKTIDGSNFMADLTRMPHLLIAGATGAGKSVALNSILVSLLYKATPDEVRLILVDPKRLELGLYSDLPHLLTPIVTDPKRAGYALKWAVSEMENRYKHLAAFGVRNIEQYNTEVCAAVDRNLAEESAELPRPLPYIVVIIDELADLMMVAAREVEESITRLAQMARAVGIHLVLATQRPSVDVITGLIKANFPSRISFRVSSKVDSRTIIDGNGAEQLLGQGDMLFLGPGTSRLIRVHGAYVDEKEVKRICDFIRSQANPTYDEKVVMSDKEADGSEYGEMAKDEKYDEAVRVVLQHQKASTSLLQRTLRIGYGRAASIIDMMHREGLVGPEDGSKPRQVLVKAEFIERLDQIREEEA